MKCKDCVFWKKANDKFGDLGWCRRYPPSMTIGQCITGLAWQQIGPWGEGINPLMRPDDWCGEWQNIK